MPHARPIGVTPEAAAPSIYEREARALKVARLAIAAVRCSMSAADVRYATSAQRQQLERIAQVNEASPESWALLAALLAEREA